MRKGKVCCHELPLRLLLVQCFPTSRFVSLIMLHSTSNSTTSTTWKWYSLVVAASMENCSSIFKNGICYSYCCVQVSPSWTSCRIARFSTKHVLLTISSPSSIGLDDAHVDKLDQHFFLNFTSHKKSLNSATSSKPEPILCILLQVKKRVANKSCSKQAVTNASSTSNEPRARVRFAASDCK